MFQSYPRRLAAAVVAVTVGLLALAAAIPPAFAQQTQATVHHAGASALTGWQVALLESASRWPRPPSPSC